MKNCNNCGAEIDEGSIYCPFCGARYDAKKKKEKNRQSTDGESGNGGSYDPRYGYIPSYSSYNSAGVGARVVWVTVLSFIFPILGLVFWYVWKFSKPERSASAAAGALAGACFSMPIAGFVLWYMLRYRNPVQAKSCGLAAIIGTVFSLVYTIVAMILFERFGIVIFL